jgi:hypothetical protein
MASRANRNTQGDRARRSSPIAQSETRRRALGTTSAAGTEAMDVVCLRTVTTPLQGVLDISERHIAPGWVSRSNG